MSMFDNYDNLSTDYIPNNSYTETFSDYVAVDDKLPRIAKDIKGNFVGYAWDYGDVFDLVFDVSETIRVRDDSLIYTTSGKKPDEFTAGLYSGQQAYNLADAKSWTFVGKSAGFYVWIEDEEITYPVDGKKQLTLFTDMSNKIVEVNIYNFRWELMHSFKASNTNKIVCKIDTTLTENMPRGVYYCTVRVTGNSTSILRKKCRLIVN